MFVAWMVFLFLTSAVSARGDRSALERSASVRALDECLDSNASQVSGSGTNARLAKLRGLCRRQEAADLAVWLKWDGDRPTVRQAVEASQVKSATEALLAAGPKRRR